MRSSALSGSYNEDDDTETPARSKKSKAMDDTTLMAAIREFEQESYGFASGSLAQQRSEAVARYLAEPYGDEIDGRSQVVDTGLRDTIEWALPPILRVFLSGDEVVKFEATNETDEKQAEQETQYVNHVILVRNDAFNVFSTWFRDALMAKVGYVKAYWRERRDVLSESYKGLTDDMLAVVTDDKDVEIVRQDSYPDQQLMPALAGAVPPPQPGGSPPQAPMLHDVKLRRVKTQGFVKVDNVPAEEIYVHRSQRTIALEDCQFIQHRARRTLSQLRQDGYDLPDDIPTSGDDSGETSDAVTLSRDRFADDADMVEDFRSIDPANRRVWFRESWMRIDYDGDGIAELRRVCHIGNTIIDNDEADLIPFAAVTPIVFPHRHIGIGFDDLCAQPSLVLTAIQRGFLDNLYLQNNGRTAIDVANVNMDDMLQSRPGGIVRVTGPPGNSLLPFAHPAAGDAALKGIEWAQTWREQSTGVAADQAAMSADVLNNSTATAIAQQVSAGQSRIESVTRSFATGMKELFSIVHALTLKNATSDEKVKLNNAWVTVDPREWVKRTALQITVGLGTGTKESRIQQLTMLGGMQAQGLQVGICTPENLYNTGKLITSEMGYKNTDEFWQDPAKAPPRPPQTPPEVQVEQAKGQVQLQIAQSKGQADAQKAQMDGQIKLQELQAEYEMHQRQAAADQAVQASNDQRDALKTAGEFQMKREQMTLESQQREMEHQREQETQIKIAEIKAGAQIAAARVAAGAAVETEMLNAENEAAGLPETEKEEAPEPSGPTAEQHQALHQSVQELTGHIQNLHRAIMTPNVLTRDERGRATGTRKAMIQ